MEHTASFFYERSPREDTSEVKILREYKSQLENMRTLFLFEMDLRSITQDNLNALTRELREIIKGIDRLKHIPNVDEALSSPEAISMLIRRASTCLYVASDLLEQDITPRLRESLYQKYIDFSDIIAEALDNFLI
ncbi:MAG: hypothetical protein ABI324_23685 [Ktedonobacteraceae bacterium]